MSANQNNKGLSLEDDIFESNILDEAHLEIDDDLKQEEIESKRQDRKERKEYAAKVWSLICRYLLILSLLVAGSHYVFCLSDSVLIALLCTTTANILGLAYIVMRYLFKSK